MAVKIQLTPQELLSQSAEMLSLQRDFEALFAQSETLLGQVNENWSERLANNFSGKLLSAQKSFRRITDMLKAGGSLAADSARTMESVDSLLAKSMENGGLSAVQTAVMQTAAGSMAAGTAAVPMAAGDGVQLPPDGGVSEYYYEEAHTDSLGLGLRDLDRDISAFLEKTGRKDWMAAYEVAKDILTDRVDWDTAGEAKKIVRDMMDRRLMPNLIRYALSDETRELTEHYEEVNNRHLRMGNYLALLTNVAGSFADEILMGGMEVSVSMALKNIADLIPGVHFLQEQYGFDMVTRWEAGMGVLREDLRTNLNQAVQAIGRKEQEIYWKTQKAIEEAAEKAKKAASEAAEGARKIVSGAAQGARMVASAVGDGMKKVGDGVRKLLKL